MPLSCSCDFDDSKYYWDEPADVRCFRVPNQCQHCSVDLLGKRGLLIPKKEWDHERDDYKYRCKSEWDRLCEPCGDLFLSLQEYGFCSIDLGRMKLDWAEYRETMEI